MSYIVSVSGGLWYNFTRFKAILFERVKYCTLCANDKWQANYCTLPPTIWYMVCFLYFSHLKALQILSQNKYKSVIIEAVILMWPSHVTGSKNSRSTNCYIGPLMLGSFTKLWVLGRIYEEEDLNCFKAIFQNNKN